MPWLREHLSGLVREYLSTVDVRIERGVGRGLPSLPNLSHLVDPFREGGLAALVQTREQRALMARMQAAMAVVEGYSEHVMDAIARETIPDHAGLRAAMDARRRSRSAPQRMIERLLGFDLKLRQYELGKRFCDAVVAAAGIEGLNRVWDVARGAAHADELEAPGAGWIAGARSRPPLPEPRNPHSRATPCNPSRVEVYVQVFVGILLPRLQLTSSRRSPSLEQSGSGNRREGDSRWLPRPSPTQGHGTEGRRDASSQRREAQPARPARPPRRAPRPS